ncbi:YigZ family protein [Alkalimonas collagenimarina]|uniref:YigZ family protein n=1 Tax=Alkalimonas collagenimarina TaxID=400390 RepID=A0ABT9H143_9GAMM|nr:YigZ family protein [Alkalimonas collagenimarina]MDP4537015.1 YigZ family protein [Alkalimonas collagenimarina]
MSHFTILVAPVEHQTTEKNSEFLTFLHPIADRNEAMQWIEHYRARYRDANHVCWAYIMGNTRQPDTQAFSDDGEPSGTAGRPMLHVLTERELGNAVAVVVRYFGGVKLGAGGLVRAYSAAVSQAANLAELSTVSPQLELTVQVNFADESKVRQLLSQHQGELKGCDYSNQVMLQITLPATAEVEFCSQLSNITAGSATIASE